MYLPYKRTIDRTVGMMTVRAETISSDYTVKTHHWTTIVLSMAGWPLLVASLLMAFVVIGVIFLLIIFRRVGSE